MIQSNKPADDDGDELDIDLDLLGIVRRRYHLIALGIFVGVTLATIYFVNQVPIYESKLAVLVGQRSAAVANTGVNNSAEGLASMQEDILATHMELFASPKIIENAINSFGLNLSPGALAGGLSIKKGGRIAEGASVLNATFQDVDPERAAKVLWAMFDSYQAYIEDQTNNVGAEAVELIEKTQAENEKALRKADQEYRDFVASVPAFVTGGTSFQDIHRTRLEALEIQLGAIRMALSESRSRRDVIRNFVKGKKPEELDDIEVMSLLNSEELSRIRTVISLATGQEFEDDESLFLRQAVQESTRTEHRRLMDLASKVRLMRAEFGDNHPSVRALETEMVSLQEYAEQMRQNQPDGEELDVPEPVEVLASYYRVLQGDIAELEKREEQLVNLSSQETKLAKEVETAFLLGSSLKANLDRAQARYDEVFQRLQEINLTSDYSGFSSELLVSPMPASFPVWPSRTKIAAMGVLAGAMLGLALAMLAEMTDRTFHDPAEVERIVGASILAHVPRLKESTLKKKVKEGSGVSPMIPTFHLPRGMEAETFRVLRTSLLFLTKSQSKKVFLLTSPSPSDGKSTTIANLAVSVAQTGKRVLLIDADMRRPTVAANFGAERSPGLSDLLSHDGPVTPATLAECVQASEQDNLTLCTSGSRTSEPSELLESDQWVAFLDLARQTYDVILIDTPPLLAVADPSIVADEVDGVFLTVRIEKNNRTLVERATEVLTDKGIAIEGVIVNSRNSRSNHYAYSSYDYYGKKQYGYVASYRRYYEANDGDDAGSAPRRKRSSGKRTTPATTRSLPIPEPATTNGHVTNGSTVNGSSNGHPAP
jgi:capsular exopolysaccharide synthesis family protein